jgi:hypothetical protein
MSGKANTGESWCPRDAYTWNGIQEELPLTARAPERANEPATQSESKNCVIVNRDIYDELYNLNFELSQLGNKALKVVLRMGEILTKERKKLPASGPNAKAWSTMLNSIRITQNSAWRYMQLWEHREKFSSTLDEITITEAYYLTGIEKRPKELQDNDPVENAKPVRKPAPAPKTIEVVAEVVKESVIPEKEHGKVQQAIGNPVQDYKFRKEQCEFINRVSQVKREAVEGFMQWLDGWQTHDHKPVMQVIFDYIAAEMKREVA